MKRWAWIGALAAVVLLSRVEHTGVEISELEPVAVVVITRETDVLRVSTDTGAVGEGETLDEAVQDLHEKTPATVFLDTAEYLLVDEQAKDQLPRLWEILRPACRVCLVVGQPDAELAHDYLQAHPVNITLLKCRAGETKLPILFCGEGELYYVQGGDQP